MNSAVNPEQRALLATTVLNIYSIHDSRSVYTVVLPTLYDLILTELPTVETEVAIKIAYAK
jgi:hypothetical protein